MSRSVAFPSGDPAFCPKGHLRLISCCVALRHPDFRVSISERDGVGLLSLGLINLGVGVGELCDTSPH